MTRGNGWKIRCGAFLLLSATAFAAPSITLSKKIGPPTSRILVSGSGFEPNVGVDIYFDTRDETLVVTNNQGEFHNARVHAPSTAPPGEHWITALERNNDKGGQKPFVVNTNWSQSRFSPQRDGVNPFENVIDTDRVGSLGVKWIYNTQLPYAWGSSIVVDGTDYIGTWDDLYALNANTGTSRWTFTLFPELLSSDPAVANGILYIGTFDEGVYALNAQTGVTLWSNACGSRGYCRVFSSPAVEYGMVYFADAEDDNGDGVYALDAKTGHEVWFSETNSCFSSAAVANGVVYIGSDDSNIYALNAFTGSRQWNFTAGDVVRTTPAVANGIIYAGSYDKNVYAINASTGTKLWSYTTAGIIESSPAVVSGVVYVGSDDGNFYALNAYTGDLVWRYATGDPYVYDPSVANGVVYFGTADPVSETGAIHALDGRTGRLLWSYAMGGYGESDPAIANGVVYMSSYNDGLIYAFAPADDQLYVGSKQPTLMTLRPDYSLKVSNPAPKLPGN